MSIKFAAYVDSHSYQDRVTKWFNSPENCLSFCKENAVKFTHIDGVLNWKEQKPVNFFKNNS